MFRFLHIAVVCSPMTRFKPKYFMMSSFRLFLHDLVSVHVHHYNIADVDRVLYLVDKPKEMYDPPVFAPSVALPLSIYT